jgi:hypothetical protein
MIAAGSPNVFRVPTASTDSACLSARFRFRFFDEDELEEFGFPEN